MKENQRELVGIALDFLEMFEALRGALVHLEVANRTISTNSQFIAQFRDIASRAIAAKQEHYDSLNKRYGGDEEEAA